MQQIARKKSSMNHRLIVLSKNSILASNTWLSFPILALNSVLKFLLMKNLEKTCNHLFVKDSVNYDKTEYGLCDITSMIICG